MPVLRETPAPPAGPLYTQYHEVRGKIHGWRPRGTKDWLLIYTELGECLIRHRGGQFKAIPGDVVLFRPGTPQDYGQHEERGRWRHVWVHWVPRPEVIKWLTWPEASPGLHRLRLPVEARKLVLQQLIFAESALRAGRPTDELLAINGVERAVLLCHRVLSLDASFHWLPRIQEAADYLAHHLEERHTLEKVAHRFGFSRSRFSLLFRRQLGQTPGEYLEAQRLSQARHLLVYTDQRVAQVSAQTGFASPFYFSLRFKNHFGLSPRTYREQPADACK